MEENKELVFEVMVMDYVVLNKAIEQHNNYNNTDFEIVEIIDDRRFIWKRPLTWFPLALFCTFCTKYLFL